MWDSNGCILQFNNVIYHLKVSSSMKISLDLVENVRYIARVSLSLHRTSTTNFIEARFWSVIAFLFQLVLQERDLLSFQAQRSFPLLWMKFSTSFFVSRELWGGDIRGEQLSSPYIYFFVLIWDLRRDLKWQDLLQILPLLLWYIYEISLRFKSHIYANRHMCSVGWSTVKEERANAEVNSLYFKFNARFYSIR